MTISTSRSITRQLIRNGLLLLDRTVDNDERISTAKRYCSIFDLEAQLNSRNPEILHISNEHPMNMINVHVFVKLMLTRSVVYTQTSGCTENEFESNRLSFISDVGTQ